MWQTESTCNPTRTFTPDSVTTYDYDYDNRLITVNLPTNSDTVEYTYDATGRRLTKEYTYHNGANTDVTTYKYHYIGSQITEIEIDAIRNPGESQTTLRDEEIKIHLGANSQPISYEWVKHISGNTTSATYYYHYDIHGNVLKVTDSSENTKITYTYDVLGKILTESNPDSILNFFTFRGASQTIWEPETGLYYSGGYYRPSTGTALQGTGAPVLTNPSSGSIINAMSQVNIINRQMAIQAKRAATTAGTSGNFAPAPGPMDGLAKARNQGPPPTTNSVEPIFSIADGSSDNILITGGDCNCDSMWCDKCREKKGKSNVHTDPQGDNGMGNDYGGGWTGPLPWEKGLDCGNITFMPWMPPLEDLTDNELDDNTTDENSTGFVDEDGDGYDDKTGFDKKGYDKSGNFNPAYDYDSSDDNTQYQFVTRDKNGKITSYKYQTNFQALMRQNDEPIHVFETNEDGTRKSIKETANNADRMTSWKNICEALSKNEGTAKCFDENGNPTDGVVGVKMNSGGVYMGVFCSKDGTFSVKQGRAGDFGVPVRYQGDIKPGVIVSNINSKGWDFMGNVFIDGKLYTAPKCVTSKSGETKEPVPLKFKDGKWDLSGLEDWP